MFKHLLFTLTLAFFLSVHGLATAQEDGAAPAADTKEGSEHKKPKSDKPRPDSALSVVIALPIVKQWTQSIAQQDNGRSITAWGESMAPIQQHECWGVAVGETDKQDNTKVWKRFCVGPLGDVWVEVALPDNSDEHEYIDYDAWVGKCKPTADSPGNC